MLRSMSQGDICKQHLPNAKGKMAEWSIAAVLKTVDLHGSGGSNPSLSAKGKTICLSEFTQASKSLIHL